MVLKRILSTILAAAMLLAAMPAALADNEGSDIADNWAKTYIEYLHDEGIINPSSSTGKYSPSAEVTRAEFMRYINRAFHFEEMADISFSDVPTSAWYYDTVRIAVKYGYIAGVGDNKMDPNGLVTREQAATIIGRIYKADGGTVSASQLPFTDRAAISSWSAGYIYDANQKGYIVGYSDGSFKSANTITRAEVARILYSYLGTALSTDNKAYLDSDLKSDTINATISESCTLNDATVKGDVYITEGVGTGTVRLNNVVIEGKLIVSGGTVELSDVTAKNMIVGNLMDREVQVTALDDTSIATVTVCADASLYESGLSISAGGFSDVVVSGDRNTDVTIEAELWSLTADSASNITLTRGASVATLTCNEAASVSGSGTVEQAVFNKSGASLSIQPTGYKLADGVTATVAGKTVKSEVEVVVSPATMSWDTGKASSLSNSYDFTFNADSNTLDRVSCDGTTLAAGSDYRAIDGGVRLYKSFLSTLDAGSYELTLQFGGGEKGRIQLTVTDSSKSTIDKTEAVFDKYPLADDYVDLEFTISAATGTQLSAIKLSGTTLTRGDDYTYNAGTGVVKLFRSALEKRSTGTSTITFVMSTGGNLTASLTVTDSTPVNALSVTEVDFDANHISDGYSDISVRLTAVEDAELKSILAVNANKTLEEGWQYKYENGVVSISRSTLASLAEAGRTYIDLRFVMSKGQNPVLRVNYVTTYAVKIKVLDDLEQTVTGATVTVMPSPDDNKASATQTAVTNSEGLATVYVKSGSYTVTVQGDKFDTVSQNLTVGSSSQSRTLRVTVMEEIDVYVTNPYGAMVSGATVTLDGKSVTTGSDGRASFRVGHGTYALKVSAVGYTTKSETFTVTTSGKKQVRLSENE